MMRKSPSERLADVRAALEQTGGAVGAAAQLLSLNPRTVRRYLRLDPTMRLGERAAAFAEANEAWREHHAQLEQGVLDAHQWNLANRNLIVPSRMRPATRQSRQAFLARIDAFDRSFKRQP